MLPFLKNKERGVAALIISKRKPDGSVKESHSEGDDSAAIESCAEDLIRAVHAKDSKAVASALQAAFEILDAMPHEEGPHTNEEQS